jgi:hypothetical protein
MLVLPEGRMRNLRITGQTALVSSVATYARLPLQLREGKCAGRWG